MRWLREMEKAVPLSTMTQGDRKIYFEMKALIMFYYKKERFPLNGETYNGKKCARFLYKIRSREINLKEEYKVILQNMGCNIDVDPEYGGIYDRCILLKEFYERYNREPRYNEMYKEASLGNFLSRLRNGEIKIQPSEQELLINMGYVIHSDLREQKLHKRINLLIEHRKKFNRAPRQKEKYKGVYVYRTWYNTVTGKNKLISRADIKRLQEVGIL